MDVIQFISSVNQISFLAFAVTVGFLLYELHLLLRERHKSGRPTIPQFNAAAHTQSLETKSAIVQSKSDTGQPHGVSHQLLVFILVIMVLILGGITLYSALGQKTGTAQTSRDPKVIIEEIQSRGITLYNKEWKEMTALEVAELPPGEAFYCAISTVPLPEIDMARIRLNEAEWKENHITTQVNKQYNVYYRECALATGEARLKVEAQFHSKKDGWLGE
jgi:hypothetical protein